MAIIDGPGCLSSDIRVNPVIPWVAEGATTPIGMMCAHRIAGASAREGFVMRQARDEVTTAMADLTRLSLTDLRSCDDPALLRSLQIVAGRVECNTIGVLQNQTPDRA
jgi:hypothetical protein